MSKTPTQNDWRKEFQGWAFDHDRRYFKSAEGKRLMSLIGKLLADARKEVIMDKIDRVKLYEVIESIYLSGMYGHDKGVLRQYMSDIINVLATLREEKTK